MKKHLVSTLALPVLWIASVSAQNRATIVDTKFGDEDAGGIRVEKAQTIPLDVPSGSMVTPLSKITVGKEALGKLEPPYALITVGGRENDPDVVANATLSWNLKSQGLSSGKFVVSYQIVLVAEADLGGTFIIVLGDEKGQRVPQHWAASPLTLFFKKSSLEATEKTGSPVHVGLGDIYAVTISFDLEAKTWSASANEEPIVDNAPFPEAFQNIAGLQVIGLEFGSLAGRLERPGGVYALKDVKMTRTE